MVQPWQIGNFIRQMTVEKIKKKLNRGSATAGTDERGLGIVDHLNRIQTNSISASAAVGPIISTCNELSFICRRNADTG